MIDDQRASVLEEELNNNLVELESRNLQLSYLKSSDTQSCAVLNEGLRNMVADYNKRLERVKTYQDKSLLRKDRFKTINRRYVLSGVRYWIFAEDLRGKCSYKADTILFFTKSIDAEACERCQKQGEQLSLLKKKYDERVLIFSVPVNIDDGMVEILKKQYNVTDVPALVLNGNRTVKEYRSMSDISTELNLTEG